MKSRFLVKVLFYKPSRLFFAESDRRGIGRMIKLLDITVKKNSLPFRQRHRASSNPAM
jgi:hypothetical protein